MRRACHRWGARDCHALVLVCADRSIDTVEKCQLAGAGSGSCPRPEHHPIREEIHDGYVAHAPRASGSTGKWHPPRVIHNPTRAMTREHASKQTRMPKGIGPGHLRMATRYPPAPFGQGLASRHVHPPIPAAARVCDIRHTPRMGLTAAAAAAQAARLTPSSPEATTNTPGPARPVRGHRRGTHASTARAPTPSSSAACQSLATASPASYPARSRRLSRSARASRPRHPPTRSSNATATNRSARAWAS